MNNMTPLEIFSSVAGAIAVLSFIINIYQYFKAQTLLKGIESVDRIAKSAKVECAKQEQEATDGQQKAETRVISGLMSSILNVTTTFMKYKAKDFEPNKMAPVISVD